MGRTAISTYRTFCLIFWPGFESCQGKDAGGPQPKPNLGLVFRFDHHEIVHVNGLVVPPIPENPVDLCCPAALDLLQLFRGVVYQSYRKLAPLRILDAHSGTVFKVSGHRDDSDGQEAAPPLG